MSERITAPEGARVAEGFPRLAVSSDGRLWRLGEGRWAPVDLAASGMERFATALARRAWPGEVRASPFKTYWADGLKTVSYF